MEQLVNFIIRPPRAEYNPDCDLLDDDFMLKGKCYQRKDMEIKNNRGDVLQCSHYMPLVSPEGKPLPCVIYCHGNSGCRADASEAAIILLPSNITVFALDFSGSGLSGGEHVTLGWNEKDDLKAVVDYLRADGNVSLIGLWGRSMGAVTSLMYGAEDPSIAGMVLDSPFSDLVELMMELVDTYKFRLPKFTVKFAIQIMRKAIQKKAKFDITELNTIKVAKSCFVPVLFGHAVDDDFIHPRHSDCIFEAYVGDKNIIKFEGDHNSPRPQFYFDSINIFFHNVLQPPEDEMGATLNGSIHDYFGKGSWLIPDLGFISESSAASKELATTSSKVAIEQVRARRPISRTEVPSDIPSEENNLGCQDKDAIGHKGSSSSDMLSFEFSNGDPFGPLVPTTTDDDQFVEYELDDLTAFPCNVEEEEKMFMEAIIESLKDLEKPEACASSSESSQKDDTNSTDTSSSTMEKYSSLSPESIPTPGEHTSDTSVLTVEPVIETGPPITVPRSTGASAQSDTAVSTQTSSDAVDISARTKATLTVERHPSNNIIDGLMRRWDLSFFRNSR